MRAFCYLALAGAVLAGVLAGPLGYSKLELVLGAGVAGALLGRFVAWRLFG